MNESYTDKGLFIVGIAALPVFLVLIWLVTLSGSVRFFFTGMIGLALWSIFFLILVVAYVYRTGCSARFVR